MENNEQHLCPACAGKGFINKPHTVLNTFFRYIKDAVFQVVLHNSWDHPNPVERGTHKQEFPDCAFLRESAMYSPGFEGEKKRKIIVIDEDNYGPDSGDQAH